jgi:hypothetical protein
MSEPAGKNQPAFPLPETWEDVLRLGVSVARVVIYEAILSLFKADTYVRRGAVRKREMKAILIVLLLMGYFMSLGRVKRRNNRNTEERTGCLSRALYYAPIFEVLIGIIGLISIGFLFWQIWEMKAQTSRQTAALQRDVISTIYGGVIELNKAFLDKSDLRPYFYSKEDISPAHTDYDDALTIAEFHLNLFDLIRSQKNYAPESQDWAAWDSWIRLSFAHSPIMCKHLNEIQPAYGKDLVDIAFKNCPGGTIQKRERTE